MPVQKQLMPQDTTDLRRMKREAFLKSLGWKNVALQPLQADASFRRYYRLQGAPKPMLLMEDPPDRPLALSPVKVEPFIMIADHLRALGLRTPEIFFKDISNGLLVIEDFGDDTYTRLFDQGVDSRPLYELAVDALVHLHQHSKRNDIDLPKHDAAVLIDGAMLLLDWYYPALTGKKATDDMKKSFASMWKGLFEKLPKDQQTLVLRDYHVDNLMLVPGATGVRACGLLDFQDASIGQFSYDLMSLLEDARRDMSVDLKQHLYDRYISAMRIDRAGFDYSIRVLAAQRHARVLGVFVRLSLRDGKTRYLQFIPHVHKLFLSSVNHPDLKPLLQWFGNHGIDIQQPLKQG